MKALLLISLYIAGVLAAAAVAQWAVAQCVSVVHFSPSDPAIAMLIAIASGLLGVLPLARSSKDDLSSAMQLAMVGTVLHLFSQAVLAGCAIGFHFVPVSASSLAWLLGGYWVSLIFLIGQLRQLILQTANTVKLQKQ